VPDYRSINSRKIQKKHKINAAVLGRGAEGNDRMRERGKHPLNPRGTPESKMIEPGGRKEIFI